MLNRSRRMWTGVLVLLLGGLLCAQGNFIPDVNRRERENKLKQLAAQLLKTKDTHERVKIRDEMIGLDTLMGKTGFAIQPFVDIYQAGLAKDATGQTDVNARLQAVIALSAIDDPKSREELIKFFDDPSEAVRLRLLKGIHDNAVIRAWEQVVPMLNDRNIEVKVWAAKTLGKLQQGAEGKASEPLIALLVKSWRELKATDFAET